MTSVFSQSDFLEKNFKRNFSQDSTGMGYHDSLSLEKVSTTLSVEQYLQEIELLKKQVKSLEEKNDVIEASKEDLVNQVSDLKALMKRVGQECEKNLRRAEQTNKSLSQKVSSLQLGLECSFKNTAHFDQMAEFWTLIE